MSKQTKSITGHFPLPIAREVAKQAEELRLRTGEGTSDHKYFVEKVIESGIFTPRPEFLEDSEEKNLS